MALQIMTPAGRLGPYDSVEALADRWIVDGAAVLRSAVGGEGVVGAYEWGVGDAPQVPELEPPAPEVPHACTRRQGLLALLSYGIKRSDIDAQIEAIEDELEREEAWIEYLANDWELANPRLQSMWATLGGTPEQLPDLFRLAVTL